MAVKIFVPIDSTSLSLGADDVADLIAATAKKEILISQLFVMDLEACFGLNP